MSDFIPLECDDLDGKTDVCIDRFFAPLPHGAFQVDPVGAVISIALTGIGQGS